MFLRSLSRGGSRLDSRIPVWNSTTTASSPARSSFLFAHGKLKASQIAAKSSSLIRFGGGKSFSVRTFRWRAAMRQLRQLELTHRDDALSGSYRRYSHPHWCHTDP